MSVGPIKPSIAQLEERGTVICNPISVLSQGRWFDPGSKDVLFLNIFVFISLFRSGPSFLLPNRYHPSPQAT